MNSRILPILALVIALSIGYGYVYQTWTGDIATLKAAIANDDLALIAANEYTAQQNELASARNAIDPGNMARLVTLLPDSVDNVGLILDLNALAARNGLSLSDIDVTADSTSAGSGNAKNTSAQGVVPLSSSDPVRSAELSLSAVGTYPALQNFLKEIEKSQRLLDVRDIVVKGSDTGVYTYEISLRFYWLR